MAAPPYLFIEEAAAYGRVSVTTLRRAIKDKTLKAAKRAGRWRIKQGELERWLETSEEGTRSRPATRPARAIGAPAPTEASNGAYLWDTMLPTKRS
jgi:excisionase family DNA binding protein